MKENAHVSVPNHAAGRTQDSVTCHLNDYYLIKLHLSPRFLFVHYGQGLCAVNVSYIYVIQICGWSLPCKGGFRNNVFDFCAYSFIFMVT